MVKNPAEFLERQIRGLHLGGQQADCLGSVQTTKDRWAGAQCVERLVVPISWRTNDALKVHLPHLPDQPPDCPATVANDVGRDVGRGGAGGHLRGGS